MDNIAEELALEKYPIKNVSVIKNKSLAHNWEIVDENLEKRKAFQEGYELASKESKLVSFPSPFTGGKVFIEEKESTVKYRGMDITVKAKYYRCEDTGHEFTDSEVDTDFMWAVFRKYWENKGFEHFYEIDGYKDDKTEGD